MDAQKKAKVDKAQKQMDALHTQAAPAGGAQEADGAAALQAVANAANLAAQPRAAAAQAAPMPADLAADIDAL